MKIITYIILLAFCSSCSITKEPYKITSSNLESQSFSNWKTDSIKSFLSGAWIHLGTLKNGKILPDTLSSNFMINNDGIKRIEIVDPSGKYHLFSGKKELQNDVPGLFLKFRNNQTDLHEVAFNPPNFVGYSFGFNCFSTDDLLKIKGSKFYRTTSFWKPRKRKIEVLYFNSNMIMIENTVYIRPEKWKEYAANNDYK
jgi:hypothetical protein